MNICQLEEARSICPLGAAAWLGHTWPARLRKKGRREGGWGRGRRAGWSRTARSPACDVRTPGVPASWAPGSAVSSSLVLSCSQSGQASEGTPVTCHRIPWEASRTAAGRAASRLHLRSPSPAQRGIATASELSPRHPDDPAVPPRRGLVSFRVPRPRRHRHPLPGASCALQDVQHLQMAPTVPWWAKPTLVKRHCSLIQHLELGGRNSPGEVRTCACSDSAGLGGELGHGLRLRAPLSVPCPRRRSSGCDGRGLHDFV